MRVLVGFGLADRVGFAESGWLEARSSGGVTGGKDPLFAAIDIHNMHFQTEISNL